MPMPVSRTTKRSATRRSSPPTSRTDTSTRPPGRLYFTALLTRLSRMRRRCIGLPSSRVCTAPSMRNSSAMSLALACSSAMLRTRRSSSFRSKGLRVRRTSPTSRRLMSSTSSISSSRCPAAPLILSRQSSTVSGSSFLRRMRSAMPRMPFTGVRKSWLMWDRKMVLARLARSAASLDSFSCRCTSSRERMYRACRLFST